MPTVLVPLANGVEEMEAVIIIDVLRRAQWTVVTAGIDEGVVTASRGVRLLPDRPWAGVDPSGFDVLMIPGGGPGVERLLKDARLLAILRDFDRAGKWIGAVCAAPLVLQAAGILRGRRATCHPGVADRLTMTPRLDERVVVDGRLVTSQGPGTTMEFALAMVRLVDGDKKAQSLAQSMGV
jgi:4-methyl-5(b-hydroxyethyl)-thiazole monophosphate biosynthesis